MTAHLLETDDEGPLDLFAEGLRGECEVLVRATGGAARPLPVHEWTGEHRPGDDGLLDRCRGATLDAGCGPGRLTVAVAARGLPVLGIDIAEAVAAVARRRGALVLVRSVFDVLPGGARWSTVLLADGNIGIGGTPVALLRRTGDLLTAGGQLLVELGPPGSPSGPVQLRLESGARTSSWFPWAHLAVDDVAVTARAAGLQVGEVWSGHERWFASLTRPDAATVRTA